MNLTGSFNGDESNTFQAQKSKSVRLNDRTKSDELESGYCGKKDEAMTNDVTPSLLKQKQIGDTPKLASIQIATDFENHVSVTTSRKNKKNLNRLQGGDIVG